MVGTSLQRGRTRGVDRPYIPVKPPRHHGPQHHRSPQGSWNPSTGVSPAPPPVPKDGAVARAAEPHVPKDPTRSEPHASAVAASSSPAEIVRSCNLRNFLEASTPWVPAQYLSKGTTNLRTTRSSLESRPYFNLADLWDSFREWSAYGVGVPLVLNDSDKVVQYYVPFLSGIQLYGRSSRRSNHSRQLSLENGDCCDFISDGSNEKKNRKGTGNKVGGSSNNDDPVTSQGHLLFAFLEQDSPFIREPLSGKISGLAQRFPALYTLGSCDLLPSSWFAVAWYPIYRIPIGPTLKDLDACFLTFHFLSTPAQDHPGVCPGITQVRELDSVHKMSLPIFGLASYKFRSAIWTRDGGNDLDVANSLVLVADNWLRLRHVELPDFQFFASRGAYLR